LTAEEIAKAATMRILFTMIAFAACAACVYFVFAALWTNVLIASIVFVLSLMGLEVVKIREAMSSPIERVVQEYLAQHPMSGVYAAESGDTDEQPHVLRLHA
jgi:hypothetical protein